MRLSVSDFFTRRGGPSGSSSQRIPLLGNDALGGGAVSSGTTSSGMSFPDIFDICRQKSTMSVPQIKNLIQLIIILCAPDIPQSLVGFSEKEVKEAKTGQLNLSKFSGINRHVLNALFDLPDLAKKISFISFPKKGFEFKQLPDNFDELINLKFVCLSQDKQSSSKKSLFNDLPISLLKQKNLGALGLDNRGIIFTGKCVQRLEASGRPKDAVLLNISLSEKRQLGVISGLIQWKKV